MLREVIIFVWSSFIESMNWWFSEDELARELEHSDSNEDDSQEISLEIEEKLLKDEPECK